jgi:acetyltransferase-like isoleucine patch superfamily enzyme
MSDKLYFCSQSLYFDFTDSPNRFMDLKAFINRHEGFKRIIHRLLIPKNEARPRLWVSLFLNRFFHDRGRRVKIRRSVRMDVLPFNSFSVGDDTIIEDFSVVNNGVGAVRIGSRSLIGAGNVLIGPVEIGDDVIFAQHVVISGLNHEYQNVTVPIRDQPLNTRPIRIANACWIGANVVITAGVAVGEHSVVAAGSVVTKDVPAFSVVAGNPAVVVKRYNASVGIWERAERR